MGECKPDNIISDELRKNIEGGNKIKPSINSTMISLQLSTPLADAFHVHNSLLDKIKLQRPRLDLIDSFGDSIGLASIRLSSFSIDTSAFEIVNSVSNSLSSSIAASIQSVLTNFSSALTETISSPFLKWLRDVDFSPLTQVWKNWNFDFILAEKYDKLNQIYLTSMYDAKWFPYAGLLAGVELFAEVYSILESSRGMSKRCEKRIDKAITSYYTKAEIKRIKKKWKESNLEPHVKKALGQTLEAYLRKEYALVIPFLATMWEGIIKSKGAGNTKKPKEDFEELVDENGYDCVFSDFYNNLIIGTCYSIDDVVEGVPNRHSVAHSWYPKYPNQKAALNAILLTDFLINLKPKITNEDNNLLNSRQEGKSNG